MADRRPVNDCFRTFINPFPSRPWMQHTGAAAPAGNTKGLKGTI